MAQKEIYYPSNEWCDEWCKVINEDKACSEKGTKWGVGWNGNFVFELQPGGGLERTTFVYGIFEAGKCKGARIISGLSEAELGFHSWGPYDQWKRVVKGELDFVEGIVKGIFRLKGDMSKVMRNARYMRALADVIAKIPVPVKYYGE